VAAIAGWNIVENTMSEQDQPTLPPDASIMKGSWFFPNDANATRRSNLLGWVLPVIMVLFFAWAGVNIYFYIIARTWQLLAVAAGGLIGAAGLILSFQMAKQKRVKPATYWFLASIWCAAGVAELFLFPFLIFALSFGLILPTLAALAIPPRRNIAGWLSVLSFTAFATFVERFEPLPRFNSSVIPDREVYLAVMAGLVLVFALVWIFRFIFRVGESIRSRLALSFALIVLAAMTATGAVTTISGLQESHKNTQTQLETVAGMRESEISTWLRSMQDSLATILSEQGALSNARMILAQQPAPGAAYAGGTPQANLHILFLQIIQQTSLFDDIYLMNTDGRLDLSNSAYSLENRVHIENSWPYFQKALSGPYITPVYIDYDNPTGGQVTLIVAAPVIGVDGKPVGVLAGHANMAFLDSIMQKDVGLGQTGETYLVAINHLRMTAARISQAAGGIGDYASSPGIELAISGQDGFSQYKNPAGIEVFGVYHWLPQLGSSLLVERDVSEAYRATYVNLVINLGLSLLILVAAIVVSLMVTQSITNPLNTLASIAIRIAAGEHKLRALVKGNDETSLMARAFNSMTDQLQTLITGLEQRVAERTHELERRSTLIQAASEVARDVAQASDLDELLNRAVNLVRDRFGYYHAGLFLVDDDGNYAVLRAATGEAGQAMLARHHKLKVGETGIVGFVVASGKPRIVSEVEADSAHFRNPLLPLTRSEMALPLISEERVIGALDVQSDNPTAFAEEDIRVLQTMADQLAVAIERSRLLSELQKNITALENAYRQYTQRSWQNFLSRARREIGYRYHDQRTEVVGDKPELAAEALGQGKTLLSADGAGTKSGNHLHEVALAVPIKHRGQTIGVIHMQLEEETAQQDLSDLLEEASVRLGAALENARLLEENRLHAEQEHLVTDISARVRASTDIDGILRTAVNELGRVMGVSEVLIQLNPGEESL
jgi:GAF domain-containing protein/HAMP domain-containing protein